MIPSRESWRTKAKEAPSPHEVRMSPLDTNPVFQSLGGKLNFQLNFNLISKNNMVLEKQPQQTNGNINETYLNNIKEKITMETENRKRLHYQIYRTQELLQKRELLQKPNFIRTTLCSRNI